MARRGVEALQDGDDVRTSGWTKKRMEERGENVEDKWWDGGGEEGGRGGWSDGGVRLLAIILHRFTPVRDGWTRNEVWDPGVAACVCLRLTPFFFFWDESCVDVSPPCESHADGEVWSAAARPKIRSLFRG